MGGILEAKILINNEVGNLEQLVERVKTDQNSQLVDSSSKETFDLFSPHTGELIAKGNLIPIHPFSTQQQLTSSFSSRRSNSPRCKHRRLRSESRIPLLVRPLPHRARRSPQENGRQNHGRETTPRRTRGQIDGSSHR